MEVGWTIKKAECQRIDAFKLWFWRRLLRVPWTARRSNQSTLSKPVIHLKDWCWSSNTLATQCEEMTHWKRPWCWERLRAEVEEGIRGWDGWMASSLQRTWTWANSRRWWGTGRPGVLQLMGVTKSQTWLKRLSTHPNIKYSKEICQPHTPYSNFIDSHH